MSVNFRYINKKENKGGFPIVAIPGLCLTILLFIAVRAPAQKKLPYFVGSDLNGVTLDFPSDLEGKKSLVAFAFSPKSREELDGWVEPVYGEFIDKESLASMVYDANVYLVIVFTKMNDSFRPRVEKELKENILKEFFGNIILTEGVYTYLKEGLEIKDDDTLWIFTMDESGMITSKSSGAFTEKKLDHISSFLEME